jgi:hypothetical protein
VNHYNWIVFKIQDLSTSDFVHSITGSDGYDNTYHISAKPLHYFVNADDMEELLKAKDIMEAACNSIYEVSVDTDEMDDEYDPILKKVPAYMDNFVHYNMRVKENNLKAKIDKAKKNKKAAPNYYEFSPDFKKLHKGRFQVYQEFAGGLPIQIELFEEDGR